MLMTLLLSAHLTATEKLLTQLRDDFAVKDPNILSYFLGIEVHHTSNGLVLTQHKYIQDLLSRTNMLTTKCVPTPMLPSEKLLDGGEKLSNEDTTRYRSVVGALQYFSLTRSDISFCVNKVYQFMSSPISVWATVKRILRYLHDTIDMGLCFTKTSSVCLVPSWMLIGPGILMTVEALEAMRSSLVAILSLGVQENNR